MSRLALMLDGDGRESVRSAALRAGLRRKDERPFVSFFPPLKRRATTDRPPCGGLGVWPNVWVGLPDGGVLGAPRDPSTRPRSRWFVRTCSGRQTITVIVKKRASRKQRRRALSGRPSCFITN